MINGRNTDGKFTDGNGGRPKGSRNKATIAIDSLLEGQAEALTQTAISKALDGDSIALRLCMDRIAPPMKDKPVVFPAEWLSSTKKVETCMREIMQQVAFVDEATTAAAMTPHLQHRIRGALNAAGFESTGRKFSAGDYKGMTKFALVQREAR